VSGCFVSFLSCEILYSKPNICQDRLGTNIGKKSPQKETSLL
jgi:hypothetical protein